MKRWPSVFKRLVLGLSFVGLVGTMLLLVTVVIEYQFTFASLSTPEAFAAALREMLEHVAMPVLVLLVPMALAGLWVIRKAFLPLRLAAERIEAAEEGSRSFRIDTTEMPDEAMPFTNASTSCFNGSTVRRRNMRLLPLTSRMNSGRRWRRCHSNLTR